MCIIQLKKKYKINYEEFIKNLMDIICGSILVIGIFLLLHFVIPASSTRIINLFIVFIYIIIGIFVYFIYAYYSKLMERIFGKNILKKSRKR